MLAAFLLAGIIAAPLGSIALLHAGPDPLPAGREPGPPPAGSCMAVIGTVVLAVLVAVVLKLLGVSQHRLILGISGVAVASVIWLPATRRWTARAHLCWATSVFLFVAYLAYALDWTINSHLGPASTAGGLLLWLFELLAAVMSCAYLWEICDALGTEHWRRRITAQTRAACRRQRPADGQPARTGAQRAAGDGQGDAPLAAAPGLPALRDRRDRRQHRRRAPVAPGRGVVRPAPGQVRPPGELARLQVRGAELRAAAS